MGEGCGEGSGNIVSYVTTQGKGGMMDGMYGYIFFQAGELRKYVIPPI